jgi:hypothetical protein
MYCFFAKQMNSVFFFAKIVGGLLLFASSVLCDANMC